MQEAEAAGVVGFGSRCEATSRESPEEGQEREHLDNQRSLGTDAFTALVSRCGATQRMGSERREQQRQSGEGVRSRQKKQQWACGKGESGILTMLSVSERKPAGTVANRI